MGNIIYMSHGGGPLPILGDKSHSAMISFMKDLPSKLKKPDAIIVVSAHWEEREATVIGHESPELFYDYYGFPDEAYELKYPVKGNPELAEKINGLLKKNGISSVIDNKRGFDHGLFIPLKMMYPEADISVTQISLIKGLDPSEHISLGEGLRSLKDENIMIIGSGFSFHNMGAFDWSGENAEDLRNDEFQDWLTDVCTGEHTYEERKEKLIRWKDAPNARYCHPREEHLLPLHVCAGIAEEKGEIIFYDHILGKRAVAVLW